MKGFNFSSQNSVSIPITIVNDVDPELDETFSVELVSVNGGARLGSDVTTTVTILRSDDVNGIFQFSGTTVVSGSCQVTCVPDVCM